MEEEDDNEQKKEEESSASAADEEDEDITNSRDVGHNIYILAHQVLLVKCMFVSVNDLKLMSSDSS